MTETPHVDFRKFAGKIGIIGFSRLFLTLSSILINAILSRLLEQRLYGDFQLANIVVRVLSLIFIFGVPTSLFYFIPRQESAQQKRDFVLQSIALLLGIGTVLWAFVFFGRHLFGAFFDNVQLPEYLKYYSFFLFFSIVSSYADAVFITFHRHKLLAVITILFAALTCGGVWTAALTFTSLEPIFIVLSAIAGIKTVVLLALTPRLIPGERRQGTWNAALLLSQMAYIIPIGLNNVIDVVSKWLDKTLVSYFFDSATLAVYYNGAMEIPFIGVLIGAIMSVTMPDLADRFHRKDFDGMTALWNRAIFLASLFLIPLFVFLMATAREVMVFLYSTTYEASTPVFRIYLLLVPLRVITFMPMLYAMGKGRTVMTGAAIDLAANLVLSLLLIPPLREMGPAVATVAATYGQAWYYLHHIRKGVGPSPGKLVRVGPLLVISGVSLACAPLVILAVLLPVGAMAKLVIASVYFPVYALLLKRTGIMRNK